MWRNLTPILIIAALGGCGSRNAKAVAIFSLTSAAFANGQAIPAEYSCDGANRSPPLAWGQPPQGTKSFALIVDDPDAPGGTFHHWGAYDIPDAARQLFAGQAIGAQAVNDFGQTGYGGPCPPPGKGPHHYRFKLLALDVQGLDISGNPKISDIENEAEKHAIGRAELTGTYKRR